VPTDDDHSAALIELLAAPPRPPTDPSLFSSNPLFGEPGIYPQGTTMEPATGPAVTVETAVAALDARALLEAAAPLGDDVHQARAPDPGPRAGLLALSVTVAAPVLDAFVNGATPVDVIGLGATASPGRIVGPPADAPTDGPHRATGVRVVNERYRAEVPPLLAGSLAHDLLWSGPGAGQYEEVVLHALVALVHLQLVARTPALARTGTELARRQNSLAITLLNSRHPGRADLAVKAPDGPGTIPGGAPGMQTPDFWSIPFVGGPPVAADAPALLEPVLRRVTGAEPPNPLRYDDALGDWWSDHGARGALDLAAQHRAAVALTLLDGDDRAGAGAARRTGRNGASGGERRGQGV
jgi:hypothetical protein